MGRAKSIQQDIIDWSINVLEKPNKHLNNFPACPYARVTRLKNKLKINYFLLLGSNGNLFSEIVAAVVFITVFLFCN